MLVVASRFQSVRRRLTEMLRVLRRSAESGLLHCGPHCTSGGYSELIASRKFAAAAARSSAWHAYTSHAILLSRVQLTRVRPRLTE